MATLKKLPIEEKLKLIQELELSIVAEKQIDNALHNDITESEEEPAEVIAMLDERLAKVESGKESSYPWEEVRERLANDMAERRKSMSNG